MFNDTSPVEVQWAAPFDALLTRLDEIAANDATTRISNHELAARAILRLLKNGGLLTNKTVMNQIIADDQTLPGGARSGFDTGKWYSIIQNTAADLQKGRAEL